MYSQRPRKETDIPLEKFRGRVRYLASCGETISAIATRLDLKPRDVQKLVHGEKLTPQRRKRIVELIRVGVPIASVAMQTGVPLAKVKKIAPPVLKKLEVERARRRVAETAFARPRRGWPKGTAEIWS